MAISNLTSYTYEQYRALTITPFPIPPGISSTPSGNPDNRITIQPAGWVGTNLLAFTVTNQAYISSNLSINNASTNILEADVNPGSNSSSQVTYWTVDMGSNASGGNWSVSFQVDDGNVETGKWVFTKGKGDDDLIKY